MLSVIASRRRSDPACAPGMGIDLEVQVLS